MRSSSNTLYVVVGALVVIVAIGGYYIYQEQYKTGISVEVGGKGVTLQTD